MKINLHVESSGGAEEANRSTRALQEFLSRPELGISSLREAEPAKSGDKGFGLGALSVLFEASVIAPLAEILKAFVTRNRSVTLKFPTENGEVSISGENVSMDQLLLLLKGAAQFTADKP